jgi:cellulose biosynthesis protein BcsQ
MKSVLIGTTKGGVGKSLVTCNVAHGYLKHRPDEISVIVDLDHQGTISTSVLKGRYKEEEGKDIGTYLKTLKPLTIEDLTPTDIPGLYIIPNYGNIDSDFFISQVPKGYQLDAVRILMENFKGNGIFFYDMPGSNGNNFLNILKVVENVIAITGLTAQDIDPIGEFVKYVELNKGLNPKLKSPHGIILNRLDKRASAHNARELQRLRLETSLPIFQTEISYLTHVPASSGFNMTVFEYSKENEQAYINFDELVKEIICKLSL